MLCRTCAANCKPPPPLALFLLENSQQSLNLFALRIRPLSRDLPKWALMTMPHPLTHHSHDMQPSSSTTAPRLPFQVWGEPRHSTPADAEWLDSDPKAASGRELAERLRKHDTCAPCAPERESFEDWAARTLSGVPRLRRCDTDFGQQIAPPAAQIPAVSTSAATRFDPYGWAFLFWVTGLVVWLRHPQFVNHWLVFAAVVLLIAPAKYLIRTALFIGVGWYLLRNYFPI